MSDSTMIITLAPISELVPCQLGIFLLIPKDKKMQFAVQGVTSHKTSKEMDCVDDNDDNWDFINVLEGKKRPSSLAKVKKCFKWFVKYS